MNIQLLDPLVAQRIAAGEVIERPQSIVRELLDNALDAKASTIIVSVTDGGLEEIKIIDDGEGIAKEDLPLLCESHATSKLKKLDDLYHISSMGFRGEALYSIAAVSEITVESSYKEDVPFQITIDNARKGPVLAGGPRKGTIVTVKGLFKELPARRQFLKRPSSEANLCQAVLLEKSFAFPQCNFRFISDNKMKVDLLATTKKQRVLDIVSLNQNIAPYEMQELYETCGRFNLYAVCSSPAIYRGDRSHIKIFVNNRPVEEYAFVQAVTYGYGESLHGGAYPYCYLFIDVDPTLVDFNIHPTKREVKLRNKAEIHHQIVTMIGKNIKRTIPSIIQNTEEATPYLPVVEEKRTNYVPTHKTTATGRSVYEPQEQKPIDQQWFQKAKEILQGSEFEASRASNEEDVWNDQMQNDNFTYLGQAFNLFLIAEKQDELFLVDQHAAHERILYDEVRTKQSVQKLMIPLVFEVERDVDDYLREHQDVYLNVGISLERTDDLVWQVQAIPALYKSVEQQLVSFIQHNTGNIEEVQKGLYAIVACHAAIKAGDTVDRMSAIALLKKVFALEEPICPHGRTFVVRLSKQELLKAVQRT